MAVAAIAAGAYEASKSILTLTKSPRYGGGDGPLYSTVNGFLTRVAKGDITAIQQLDQLRKNDVDKEQWQKLWDEMVPLQPLTQEQRDLIIKLDPSKAAVLPSPRVGSPVLASPGVSPPTIQDVLQGLAKVTAEGGRAGTAPDRPALSGLLPSSLGQGAPLWLLLAVGALLAFGAYKLVKGAK